MNRYADTAAREGVPTIDGAQILADFCNGVVIGGQPQGQILKGGSFTARALGGSDNAAAR